MSEWWTYRLSDLILFSPDVYYSTFGLYHHRVWPAHLVVVAVMAVGTYLLLRPARSSRSRGQLVAAFLAASWLWIGLRFHLTTYSTINWAARYFAVAFVVEAVFLLWYGMRGRLEPGFAASKRGLAALLVIAALAPLAGLATGRAWDQVEFLGLTPDPTAVATIALLLLSGPRTPRVALVIPVLWCVIGGLTLYALGSPEAWWVVASSLGALFLTRVPFIRSRGFDRDRH